MGSAPSISSNQATAIATEKPAQSDGAHSTRSAPCTQDFNKSSVSNNNSRRQLRDAKVECTDQQQHSAHNIGGSSAPGIYVPHLDTHHCDVSHQTYEQNNNSKRQQHVKDTEYHNNNYATGLQSDAANSDESASGHRLTDSPINDEDLVDIDSLQDNPQIWWRMWNSSSRMSMSMGTSKGLLNAPGANNCFLNSAVQVSCCCFV